jgi:hypothetical protein
VVFAHGSGSSRHSRRNRYVADTLATAGLGTLLSDLLTDAEADDRRNTFDIELLGERLRWAVVNARTGCGPWTMSRWIARSGQRSAQPPGCLGQQTQGLLRLLLIGEVLGPD